MKAASDEQEFEQAAQYRNQLKAVRSLLERQRISNEAVGTLDAIAVAAEDTDANAQVFQVRDGVLADRQSFYLENAGRARRGRGGRGVRAPVLRQRAGDPAAGDRPAAPCPTRSRSARRSPSAAARRWRSATPSAATSGASSSWPSATRAWRSTRTGCAPSAAAASGSRRSTASSRRSGMDDDPDAHRVLRHLQPDGHAHGRLDGGLRGRRAEEVRLPALRHPRTRCRTTSPRWARCSPAGWPSTSRSASARPHDRDYDESFAALPSVIVIDGGKGQLSAGLRELGPFRDLGVTVDQPGQADRGGVPARAPHAAASCPTRRPSCSCSSACATRRTASRSSSTAAAATGR